MNKRTASTLPDDLEADQLWRGSSGQHYRVFDVSGGIAALHRATPAGRVHNTRYVQREPVEKMQPEWALVSG